MNSVTNRTHRGSALVFALLAIIAFMAIAVVFISRAGRDEPVTQPGVDAPATTAPDETLTSSSSTSEPDIDTTAADSVPPFTTFPPPPPPPVASTPDPKTLPPEG